MTVHTVRDHWYVYAVDPEAVHRALRVLKSTEEHPSLSESAKLATEFAIAQLEPAISRRDLTETEKGFDAPTYWAEQYQDMKNERDEAHSALFEIWKIVRTYDARPDVSVRVLTVLEGLE